MLEQLLNGNQDEAEMRNQTLKRARAGGVTEGNTIGAHVEVGGYLYPCPSRLEAETCDLVKQGLRGSTIAWQRSREMMEPRFKGK